jgi:hypothetical protein
MSTLISINQSKIPFLALKDPEEVAYGSVHTWPDCDFDQITNYINSKIKEKTGLDAAKWLIEHSKSTGNDLPQCYTHSANPIGCCHIMGYINLYLKLCKKPENCVRVRWDYQIQDRIFKK